MLLKLLLLFLPLIHSEALQLNKLQKEKITSRVEYQLPSKIDGQDILLSIEVQTKDQPIKLQIGNKIKSIQHGKRYFYVIQDDQAK